MRTAFIKTLTNLARENETIFLLTGDLGFSVFEDFQEEFPRRFFDIGVAEQNMIGIAAGLALSGKIVFVYSIIPFTTMRCFEQIRNDLCMQNLNVNIVGVGAGLDYGPAGPTHHAIEDMGILRSLPNMVVSSPCTADEAGCTVKSAVEHKGPVYIRLGRCHGQVNAETYSDFRIGKGILLNQGSDITIIGTGAILSNAQRATERLEKKGIKVRLISMHTIKPIDKEIILKAAKETKAVFTIEEHSLIGGLGSAVAEVLAESDTKVAFKRLGLRDEFIKDIGDREYLLDKNNLSIAAITKTVLGVVLTENED